MKKYFKDLLDKILLYIFLGILGLFALLVLSMLLQLIIKNPLLILGFLKVIVVMILIPIFGKLIYDLFLKSKT